MEAIVFVGIPGTGKSTFFRERFFHSHVRINLDMLRTRNRERLLLRACLEGQQAFVVDNTNPTRAERAPYLAAARDARFRVVGFYFASSIGAALERNAQRPGVQRIPDVGVKATHARLELPQLGEGFDALFYVRLSDGGGFDVEEWKP